MRHYEVVLLVHPSHSERVPSMLERYFRLAEEHGGKVHRKEDWGRLGLAYVIQKQTKAHYLLLNLELPEAGIEELHHLLRFNDAVLRYLVLTQKGAPVSESEFLSHLKREQAREKDRRDRRSSEFAPSATESPSQPGDAQTEPEASEPAVTHPNIEA